MPRCGTQFVAGIVRFALASAQFNVRPKRRRKLRGASRSRTASLVGSEHRCEALELRRLLSANIYVDASATGTGDGSSWANAYTDLQTALTAAENLEIMANPPESVPLSIDVAQGVYRSTDAGPDGTFQLFNDVAIYGGYAGASNPNAPRNLSLYPTVLSGYSGFLHGNFSSYHVVAASQTNASAVLDGFTITGGDASGTGGALSDRGAGMFIGVGSPTINNCIFTNNTALNDGGAIYMTDSASILTDCVFTANSVTGADGIGGAVVAYGSYPKFNNCTFTGNSASTGGALGDSSGSTATLSNCILWNDRTGGNGQEIFNDGMSGAPAEYSDIEFGSSSYAGNNNLFSDPQFISSTNLQLQATSPCINVGYDATIVGARVTTDVAGNPRIADLTVDMGAYEYQGPFGAFGTFVLYVDQSATGASDGSSWANAYTDLGIALAGAEDLEAVANRFGGGLPVPIQIHVAQGTYNSTSVTGSSAGTFQLLNDVSIYGGYAGASNPSTPRNTSLYPTTLNGYSGRLNGNFSSYHVVTGSGADSTAVLDGFTITGGVASGTGDPNSGFGGGMINIDGSPTIRNCIFAGNTALDYGGAIYDGSSSSPGVTDCVFTGNSVTATQVYGIGGAVFDENSSSPKFTNCTFTGNSAAVAGGALGQRSNSMATLTNCILWNDPTGGGEQETFDDKAAGAFTHAQYSDIEAGTLDFAGSNNLFSDPHFVSNTNLQLQVSSPCINRGLNSAVTGVAADLAGNPRIADDTVDMGAYEYQGPFVLFVDQSATHGGNNGTSWADAFLTLQQALNVATPGFTIDVAAGDYSPGTQASSSFQLVIGVTIRGGFANGGSGSPAPSTHLTYLDGGHTNNHVVTASGTDPTTVLYGFTIENGNANGAGFNGLGGGLLDIGGSPRIIDCTFIHNVASQSGGGMANVNSSDPLVVNCLFQSNSAANGGGMDNENFSLPYLFNTAFTGNSATNDGGGMNNASASTAALVNCTFAANNAAFGGAIANEGASPSLVNCILWLDSATSNSEIGTTFGAPSVQNSDVDQSGYAGSNNNINQDPLFFVNLQLEGGSPCIDAGSNTAAAFAVTRTGVNTDLAGHPRIVNAIVDMGAYENQGPVSLVFAPGPPSSIVAGTTVSPAIKVNVEQGGRVSTIGDGTTVTLSIGANPVASATVANGQAVFSNLVFNTPGTYVLTATDGTDAQAMQQFTVTPAGGIFSLVFQNGGPAGGTAGQPLPSFSVVVYKGGQADPGDNSFVSLYLDGAGSAIATTQANNGVAVFSGVVINATGSHTLQAQDPSDSATPGTSNSFNVNPPPTTLSLGFVNQPSDAIFGGAISPAITVDVYSTTNGVTTLDTSDTSSVTLSVATGPPGSTLGGTATEAVMGGVATFNNIVPSAQGTYTLIATDSGGSTYAAGNSVSFTVAAPAVSTLVFTTQPTDFTIGPNVAVPTFAVSVEQNGVVQTGDNSLISIQAMGSNIYSYGGVTGVYAVNGVATFSQVYLGKSGRSFFVATDTTNPSDVPATSNTFTVSAPVYSLRLASESNGTAGASASLTVDAFDATNNPATSYAGDQTFTLVAGPAGATLGGTYNGAFQAGAGTINNIILDQAGSYTLAPSDPSLDQAVSQLTFTIGPANASQLAFIQQPSKTAAGYAIVPPVTVAVEDQFDNVVTTDNSDPVTLSIASPAGDPLGGVVTVTAQNGVASFANVSIAQVGTYTLDATDGIRTALPSSPFDIVAPATIYVDQNATGGNNGQDWLDAYANLQSALTAAIAGDTIDVAQGDYSPGNAPTATFQLIGGLTVQGGYQTGGLSGPSPAAYPTLLDGMNSNYHVVTGIGTSVPIILEGLTITGGDATGKGDSESAHGAGMIVNGGVLIVSNCAFIKNAAGSGGGLYASNSASVTLNACTFSGNSAMSSGGGIDVSGSATVTLTGSTLSGNSASSGGGIGDDAGTALTLINCTLSGNTASGAGGAIESLGTLSVTDSTLSGNSASGGGGGIDSANGGTINGTIVDANAAPVGVQVDLLGGNFVGSYNLVGVDNTASFSNGIGNNIVGVAPADLHLASLGNYGGPTQTMEPLSDSPAIDAGSTFNAPDGSPIITDQRGGLRIVNDRVDIGAVELQPLPTVASFVVNDGSAQRSMVTSLTVNFNGPVVLGPLAITLTTTGGTPIPFSLSSSDNERYTLSFGGSLTDGRYVLTVHANLVTNLFGQPVAADQSYSFFRLFGDYDGNGKVNNADYFQFNRTFGRKSTDAGFLSLFDFNGDGIINNSDYFQFNKRFGMSV